MLLKVVIDQEVEGNVAHVWVCVCCLISSFCDCGIGRCGELV